MPKNTKTSIFLTLAILAMTVCASMAHVQQRLIFDRGYSGSVAKDANRVTVELQQVDVSSLSLYANEKPKTGGNRIVVYLETRNAENNTAQSVDYALFIYRDSWTLRRGEAGIYSVEVGTGSREQVEAGAGVGAGIGVEAGTEAGAGVEARQDITVSFDSSLIPGEIIRCWPSFLTASSQSDKPQLADKPDDLVQEVQMLLQGGRYDKIIEVTSPVIEKARAEEKQETLDRNLLYARGYAAWRTGYYAMSQADFSVLGDFAPDFVTGSRYKPASEFVQRIQTMKALVPPYVHDIKEGDTVIFRVYYTQDDEWTEAIVDMLPLAYAINRKMLGNDMMETAVFIFSDYEKFSAFYKLRGSGTPPGSWMWAAGGMGSFYFCQNPPQASAAAQDIESTYFQATVVHEYNHCVVRRLASGASIPQWFSEGLASVAEGHFSTSRVRNFAERMQRALSSNAVLPLEELSRREDFVANTEEVIKRWNDDQPAGDPYVQSYWMTSYFLSLLPKEGLTPFLLDLRDQRSFKKVFQKHTGLTLEEFHKQWQEQLPKSIR